MSGAALEDFLHGHGRIGLDTSIFIFLVERNPKYIELVRVIFRWLEGARAQAVTSTVTMLELLVSPYRAGDLKRVNDFYALLSTYPHLSWIAPTLEIADRAAQIRAELNLGTPDAIQAATAWMAGAGGFISNDKAFRRWTSMDVLILDHLA